VVAKGAHLAGISRYGNSKRVLSGLDPLEDVTCWVEGLTSRKYAEELLASRHTLKGSMTIAERSESVAKLTTMACKYLDQAAKGPREVSFLPLYYAFLCLSKAYITIGPFADEIVQNRRHGATYDVEKNPGLLEDDFIGLYPKGTIPLLYRTLLGESMFQKAVPPIAIKMGDIYRYIVDISAEYSEATGKNNMLVPFTIDVEVLGDTQRIVASYAGVGGESEFNDVNIADLQAFKGLNKEDGESSRLVSKWYDAGDTESMLHCVRPALLYGHNSNRTEFQFVPQSGGDILLPEEIPLLCAFYHMSCVVRYNPEALGRLADSKFWPVLLALRRHGTYKFLLLFWNFATQCCTYIEGV
jgi:hypothetical protein